MFRAPGNRNRILNARSFDYDYDLFYQEKRGNRIRNKNRSPKASLNIRVHLEISGALLIRSPAVKLYGKATVGRRQKTFTLFYNPINKAIDALVCDGCGQDMVRVHFCARPKAFKKT